MAKLSNKWTRAAIPALLLHCSIGTVYCWSYFSGAIKNAIELANGVGSADALGWAFSLAIFFLGMSAAFLGNFVEKDIHKASLIATLCFAVGVAGTGLAIRLHSIPLILVCYGVIMGIGLGLGYLSPVKTLMLWFKNNKGLATGLAVAGFGAAKMVFAPIITALIDAVGVEFALYILAGVWFVMMFVGHLLLSKPEGWVEPHEKFEVKAFFARFKIFLDPKFIGIWLVFYINITCGLALISQEKNIYMAIGLSGAAALLGTMTGFFNAAGRLGYSAIGDHLKDRNTIYKIILISEIIITALALFTGAIENHIVVICIILLVLVNLGYGGGFSNLPTLLSDVYGMSKISSIHGIALSAWAVAGLTGNQIADLIVSKTGSYQNVLIFTLALYAVAILVDFLLIRTKHSKSTPKEEDHHHHHWFNLHLPFHFHHKKEQEETVTEAPATENGEAKTE
ncbi:MAG: OFA family MFS transporter [Clostridia bacterium]|nr:OFA family MFS transporter [Clostridia bacterium]